MSNNNLNKDHSWKSRLAELESLPGEAIQDKKASRDILRARMQDKPSFKKYYWYWAAAACLILISILPFLRGEKQVVIVAKKQPVQFVSDTAISNPILFNDTTNQLGIVAAEELPQAVQYKIVKPSAPQKIQSTKQPVIEEREALITIVNSVPVTDSVKSFPVVVIPKKKLSIVHINELTANNGAPTVGNSFTNTIRRFIRPSNKDMSIGTPTNNTSKGDHILIKNINPQNQD